MKILALDMATTTGWAMDHPDPQYGLRGAPISGHWDLHKNNDEDGEVFYHFEHRLANHLNTYPVDALAYEAPLFKRDKAQVTMRLVGLAAIAQLLAYTYRLRIQIVSVRSARAHLVDDGNADKQQVWHRCITMGWHPKTLDESDAMAIWSCAHGILKTEEIKARARG